MTHDIKSTLSELEQDWGNWRPVDWPSKYKDSFVISPIKNSGDQIRRPIKDIKQVEVSPEPQEYRIDYTPLNVESILKTVYKKAVEDLVSGMRDRVNSRFG